MDKALKIPNDQYAANVMNAPIGISMQGIIG